MSTDLIESRVSRLSSLCRDYIAVLVKQREEAEEISQALVNSRSNAPANEESRKDNREIASARFWAIQAGFYKLQPALEKLVRAVSQTIEHATSDDMDSVELTVLLADLEANLMQNNMLFARLGHFAN